MRLYVETNFVLEVALDQRERMACDGVLAMAENDEIELAIPAYALVEPYETLIKRQKERQDFQQLSTERLTEIARSQDREADATRIRQSLADLLARSAVEERANLDGAVGRIVRCATVIPVTHEVLTRAAAMREELGLGPQDSVMLASIDSHLIHDPQDACFVTTDRSDFGTPDVEDLLGTKGCRLLWRFEAASGYVISRLNSP